MAVASRPHRHRTIDAPELTMTKQDSRPLVGIIMGSDSDLPVMQAAADALTELGVPFEMTIVSAHRTPKRLYDYAGSAVARGLKVIIAGAGGAAHLPGMAAAITPLPVIGVPVKSRALSGEDSLLSIVQMPPGVPVATVAIDGARNAGLLAAQILAVADEALLARVEGFKRDLEAQVLAKVERMATGEITAESVAQARSQN
jgi:5-(carboxyamino)imidazole ribonucleotide mutase